MSLFKAREWWSVKVNNQEDEFDQGSLCVGNLDGSYFHQIVVGSYAGFLQIYSPKKQSEEKNGHSPSDDLLIEYNCKLPILQVSIGRFVSGYDRNSIAVLHPRKLSVYTLLSQSGSTSHGNQWHLKSAYEHQLQRSAFNFCHGPFGQVEGKDFICVQSVDATLLIYEQENYSFSRFLPESLLPGPLVYLAQSDVFLTVSSTYQIEAYRYQVLAVAVDSKTKEESQNIKTGKRVVADWTLNVGETAICMKTIQLTGGQMIILVLGRKNLFCVTETGKLEFTRRFDFTPSCLCIYSGEEATEINQIRYVLSTIGGQILICKGTQLLWAAKCPHLSVDMAIVNFEDLNGLIVSLDESGHLDCLYLGTDPAINIQPPAYDTRDIDYDHYDSEMASVQRRIKNSAGLNPSVVAPSKTENDIKIQINTPLTLDVSSRASNIEFNGKVPPSCTAVLTVKPRAPMNNVQIHIEARAPLMVSQKHFYFSYIDSNHPPDCVATFYVCAASMLCYDLQVKVIATYMTIQNAPRVSQTTFNLPLSVCVEPCLPVKQASFKLTIDTNHPPANLNVVFNDFICEGGDPQGCALGFKLVGDDTIITILASKTSQRYRLQSDSFGALGLMVKELTSRLGSHFGPSFQCSLSEDIPLADFFTTLDDHWQARSNLKELEQVVEERATQLRAIQRRLLTRFKDKTPQPLGNLDTLLEGSLRQLSQLADMTLQCQLLVDATGNNFASACRLLVLLINYSKPMPSQELAVLTHVLTSADKDYIDCGMEEILDCALTHMLRSVLSKSSKDIQMNTASLQIPSDTTKLKKHIQMLCEKVSRGVQLSSSSTKQQTAPMVSKFQSMSIIEPTSETTPPPDSSNSEIPLSTIKSPRNPEKKKKKKKRKKDERDEHFDSGSHLQLKLPTLDEVDDNLTSFPEPANEYGDNFYN